MYASWYTWTCESCLAYLKDSVQPPYDYSGTLRGLLELFISVHNNTVEEKKRFVVGNVTVADSNDYISYSNTEFSVTLDAIRDKLIKTHGGFLRVRYAGGVKYICYISYYDSETKNTVNIGLGVTLLWSGTCTTGSCAFSYGSYNWYVIIGQPASSGSRTPIVVPKAALTTSAVAYQITDESYYYSFNLYYSGTTAYAAYKARNSSGQIIAVYGVN